MKQSQNPIGTPHSSERAYQVEQMAGELAFEYNYIGDIHPDDAQKVVDQMKATNDLHEFAACYDELVSIFKACSDNEKERGSAMKKEELMRELRELHKKQRGWQRAVHGEELDMEKLESMADEELEAFILLIKGIDNE